MAIALPACGSSGGNSDATPNNGADGGPGGVDGTVAQRCGDSFPESWTFETIETGNTGWQPAVARAPSGKVGIAWFKRTGMAGTCSRIMGNPAVTRWAVMYAESDGGPFVPEQIGEVDLISVAGVGLTFNAQNQPVVAYMGGMEASSICGGTDLMMATKAGAGWTVTMVTGDGMATPVFPEDVTACAQFQNTCNVGDVAGEWPALTFANDQVAIAFRDTHYGIAQDDFEKSDLELWWGGQRSTIDATWGGGVMTQAAADGQGRLFLAHANKFQTQNGNGIWVFRYDGAWTRQKVSTHILVGYRLSMAAQGNRVAIAYHAEDEQKLRFIDSADGTTWAPEAVIDQSGNTGRSPSLTFGPGGTPAVSYHHCGPFMPGSSDCEPDDDALRFAVHEAGRWCYTDVSSNRGGLDGDFTAMTFDGQGRPVIAFQAIFVDPSDGSIDRQLRVARGVPR